MADVIRLEVDGESVDEPLNYTSSRLPDLPITFDLGWGRTSLSVNGEVVVDDEKPNSETAAAYHESIDHDHLPSYSTVEDFWASLNSDN